LAVALASFKLLLPAALPELLLPCQISLSFLMRSCVPALAIVGQPSRYPVAVPPELTGFRLRVLCICESSTAYSSPNNT
jgi:hypothetical protein